MSHPSISIDSNNLTSGYYGGVLLLDAAELGNATPEELACPIVSANTIRAVSVPKKNSKPTMSLLSRTKKSRQNKLNNKAT